VIDRIRQDIQQRLEQLQAEAEKLGRALAALDPREKSAPAKPTPKPPKRSAPTAAGSAAPSPATSGAPTSPSKQSARPRTASGATRAKVLAALSTDGAMTAGEIANATGLGRASVSTTLSKLAKTGAAVKAERGYRLPAPE